MALGIRLPSAYAPEPGTVVADHTRLDRAWLAHDGRWNLIDLDPGQRCHGYATGGGRHFLALYVKGGTICLQAGDRAWDCASIQTITRTTAGFRTTTYDLQLNDGLTERIQARVPVSVALRRLTDSRFDDVDTWWDDLIQRLPVGAARGASGWVQDEYERWNAGFTHSLCGSRL